MLSTVPSQLSAAVSGLLLVFQSELPQMNKFEESKEKNIDKFLLLILKTNQYKCKLEQ